MKQKDIVLIVVIAIVAGVISLVVSSLIFVTPANRHQNVEVVQPISTNFPALDSKYFNPSAIDPSQTIKIGTSTNPAPFNPGS